MEPSKPPTALFDVYLRLRPSSIPNRERCLDVEEGHEFPTHINIKPPANDYRKRAIERFAFTRVFEEHAGQKLLFESTGILPMVEGVLGAPGREGRDGLLATLGVTGSGKTHTILGSKSQRGLTQLTLDVLFQHVSPRLADVHGNSTVFTTICSSDVSEAQIRTASGFLDDIYGDVAPSRGATPTLEASILHGSTSRKGMPRVSSFAQYPPINDVRLDVDDKAEYAIVVSMYEVYNDKIYDLLTTSSGKGITRRRPMLFKNTEQSLERKVVAGLRKVLCSTLDEALLVLETGLHERQVAGTGSNATSSRSHGFFNIEIKKRRRSNIPQPWSSSTLTIADLAGSERARAAKTAGSTLAEAGKINESLMHLGHCMQSAIGAANAPTANATLRRCKLTELLFYNSLSANGPKTRQRAVMIVTADPLGDFNATSQMLRYSALAREVTAPRTPSITQILSETSSRPGTADGQSNPAALQEDLQFALAEISRLRDQLEVTQVLLEQETQRRQYAEDSWCVAAERLGEAEDQIEGIESQVREEVCAEMEERLALEMRRWKAARDAELDYQDAHIDRKLELYAQGLSIHEDAEEADKENMDRNGDVASHGIVKVAELENENAQLRRRVEAMEKEKLQSQVMRTPSKKMRVLKARKWEGSGMGLDGTTE